MHRQVALGVQRHRPEGVVIILRPGQRQNRHGAAIALNQVSDERWQMFTLPRQQNGLIGKMAAGKKKVIGVLGEFKQEFLFVASMGYLPSEILAP